MLEKKYAYKIFIVLALLFVNTVIPVYAETIKFGVYTSDKPTTMYKKFKPILDYLKKEVNLRGIRADIKIKIYPSYSHAIEALVKKDCDFVRFGPASYIIVKQLEKNIRLLAMEHKKNKKRFNGVFIVSNNSTITSIKDLTGKTFAFGNKNSTIGRYLSQAELVKAGINASGFKHYKYLGRHDKVALAVAAGNYDAGVVKENTYKKYAKSKGLKKIGQFPNVTKPWVVRAEFNDKMFNALKDALLTLKDKEILKNLKQDGFLPTSDEDYDFVRKGMEKSKEFFKVN